MELRLRLRDLREDHDLSQTEVAKMIKCSQQTYSRYEAYITEIPLQSLITLAEFYNTSVDYLIGITNTSDPYPR